MSAIEIRHLGAGDEATVARAGNLFDNAPIPASTAAFLAASDHHLLIAFIGGEPAGFVSGVETIHPDKGTEMFLYELGVDEAFRGRGVGTGLVRALADLAREQGCYGMWVLTDLDNEGAIATYRRAGATDGSDHRMLEWRFREASSGSDSPGPDSPGPDSPPPDSPGPDSPGPDSPGPDSPGPDSPGPDS